MKNTIKALVTMLLLSFLVSLALPVTAASTEASVAPLGEEIKIMSYNVMDDCTANSNGVFPYASPAEREDAIVKMLEVYSPDVIGMQEAGDGGVSGILDWCAALDEDLKHIYAYRSITDETGFKMDICRGLIIFYKKDRFTLLESGGQGYAQPANNKRCFHWVLLRDETNGVEFYVFNTHWHVDGKITLEENEVIRTAEMQELANKVNTLAKDRHCILVGDFNSFYSPKNSMGDTKNITRLQENTGFVDALLSTDDKCSIDAKGTVSQLQSDDSGLMTSADHVVYPPKFYTSVKLERILSRTYSPKLSDHDAFLVHFQYKLPELTARAQSGDLEVYVSDGAYYIDNMAKRSSDLPVTVELLQGEIFTDEACTKAAGTELTIKNATSNTYMGKNSYYIKFGNLVYPLYLRSCNSSMLRGATFVDPSFRDKEAGERGLYCDKWYCRPVTIGVNGFATIQEAVDGAQDGERVMVAPGTYEEDVSYTGKSIDFYGSNRNNSKALVIKDGQLTVNTGRSYETYLSGSITFAFGDLQKGSLMVNGFHFIDSTAMGQIRITGGNAKKLVDLRICNNLFNCYTDGAVNNGSAIHANTALQKTGSIEDNYFHLTNAPTYTDSSGATVNYTNRAITMRNMKDMTIHANYFHGYTGSKIRPFWLSSEVSSESTIAGYGNLAFTGNRLEDSTSGSIYINNVRGETNAELFIAGNSYGGQTVAVDFRETAKQGTANLPTDKSKVTFFVHTEDLPSLKILPASNSGIETRSFSKYATFRNDKGDVFFDHAVVEETGVVYEGVTPWKEASDTEHYTFKEWVDADGNPVDLSKVSATMDIYAAYTATPHSLTVSGEKTATCTEDGYSGDQHCAHCGHVVKGEVIPAKGHSVVMQEGYAPTCTAEGLSEGSYCDTCKTVLAKQEAIAPLGHDYVAEVTVAPTLDSEGMKSVICQRDPSHSYTETLEKQSKSLYFGFDGKGTHYHNYVYNFTDFDLTEAWRGRTQGYKEGTAAMDPKEGTLTVQPGVTGYGSIFADSVNLDLNYDPKFAESYQIRFKVKGFTGTSCKVGMYFYYSTDNSYLAAPSVGYKEAECLNGEYFVATGSIPQKIRDLGEVNRVVVYLSGFDAPSDLNGELTLDYIYAGPNAQLPLPIYTVSFEDGAGTVLDTQRVYRGESVVYKGKTPTKDYDSIYHYSFNGWDKALSNITADTVITAVYTATAHSSGYEQIDRLTHRVFCPDCGMEEVTSHVYVDGFCICGDKEIREPMMDSSLKLSHSLNLASDISINFVVPAYLLEGYDMSTVYVESIIENYEGESFLGTEAVRMEPVEMGSYYYFTLTGITAVQMNDTISTVLYGEKDGQPYYSDTDLYSVAQYAYSQLNKANSTETLKTLCADLLRYGAKAQIYKEYRISSLADADMTEEHKSYLSDLEAVTFGNNSADLGDLANAPITWVGKTLDLDSKVCLKFVFNTSNYTGKLSDLTLKVTYKDIYGETMEVTVTEVTAYDAARNRYAFSVDALLASELREVVSVQVFAGNSPVSTTFQYSADTYGNNKTGTLLELCKALFAYSDSAKAYFAN